VGDFGGEFFLAEVEIVNKTSSFTLLPFMGEMASGQRGRIAQER
jgi:hypothetical protein